MDAIKKDNNKKANIKAALSIATGALLGTEQSAKAQDGDWEYDTAFLYYSEAGRVSAAEAIVSASKVFENDEILNVKLTIDALTGASANGAVAQPEAQTFTRPSGNGQYQVQAGETPLDDTFHDTRVQLNGQWTQLLIPNYTASIGAHISKEYDYLSLGVNANLAYDFNKKNSTLSIGLSHFHDTISPEGGIPVPGSSMLTELEEGQNWGREFAKTRLRDKDDKATSDVLLGFTQVINRRMITQFNYSYSRVSGYLTDPFKVLSLVNTSGFTQDLLYEHRPGKRSKQNIFAQVKYHFKEVILDTSYRYMWDDWQIKSHTLDMRLRVPLSDISYIEPHIRLYHQGAAGFYRPFLTEGEPLPLYASADYRVGEMTAYTLGFKYGTLINDKALAFRLEYYRQNPKNAGFEEPGVLAEQELYESVNAIIAQVSYSF